MLKIVASFALGYALGDRRRRSGTAARILQPQRFGLSRRALAFDRYYCLRPCRFTARPCAPASPEHPLRANGRLPPPFVLTICRDGGAIDHCAPMGLCHLRY